MSQDKFKSYDISIGHGPDVWRDCQVVMSKGEDIVDACMSTTFTARQIGEKGLKSAHNPYASQTDSMSYRLVQCPHRIIGLENDTNGGAEMWSQSWKAIDIFIKHYTLFVNTISQRNWVSSSSSCTTSSHSCCRRRYRHVFALCTILCNQSL